MLSDTLVLISAVSLVTIISSHIYESSRNPFNSKMHIYENSILTMLLSKNKATSILGNDIGIKTYQIGICIYQNPNVDGALYDL